MSRVKRTDTKPELRVRRLLYSMGYRYRLHAGALPGKPDIVFRPRKCAIFVHGCFWHRHGGCALCRLPKSRLSFWKPKLEGNRLRDLKNQRKLKKDGWRLLVIWECELRDEKKLKRRVLKFLESES
jgi:DNA mismatch endonuclease (patch repair protein)